MYKLLPSGYNNFIVKESGGIIMPRGERRSRKEVLAAQIELKNQKITEFNLKIERIAKERSELQEELDAIIENEIRAEEEAKERELLDILKVNGINKEQLEALINVCDLS